MPAQARIASAPIVGLVLAAGGSVRMGHETNKLTQPIVGKPLVAWPVDAMHEAAIDPIVVVTGHDAAALHACLAPRRCRFVHNDRWAEGMGASLAVGARHVAREAEGGLLVCLGDLPGLRAELIRKLVDVFREQASRDRIVLPVANGTRGHPVLFGAGHLPELSQLAGDVGARAVLERHAECVVEVEVDSEAILSDVDTPEQLAAWRAGRSGETSGR